MLFVLDNLDRFAERHTVVPQKADIFNMFRMLHPRDVKVVIVAQSPYPGNCPSTNVPYACGPALLPAPGCTTTPETLRRVLTEACENTGNTMTMSPRDTVLHWIEQGVLLLNASLTLGKDCPQYLEDHSIAWEEVMHGILSAISMKTDPVFLLIGRDAWRFEKSVNRDKVIMVSHPTARKETATPWSGSRAFTAISTMMVMNGSLPIRWIT